MSQVGQGAVFHINHIIPRSKGGATIEANLVLQCPYCSLRKADKTFGIDPITGVKVALFDPLRQQWPEHFVLDAIGGCQGKTPFGRGTVEALQMNELWPKVSRAIQIRLGIISLSGS